MSQLSEHTTPATLAGKFGAIQIVTRDAGILLDVQGVHRGVDGIELRDHGFAILTREEAAKLRDLLTAMLTRRQKALAA